MKILVSLATLLLSLFDYFFWDHFQVCATAGMHASSARWQCWERHQMAWALASSSTDTSLLVKQFPDGNLWETISSRLCHGPWTLEASGEQVIFDQFWHQLVQCEKCHGHESSLWGVIFVNLLLCLTKAQYASHIRPSFRLIPLVCADLQQL